MGRIVTIVFALSLATGSGVTGSVAPAQAVDAPASSYSVSGAGGTLA